MGEIFFADKVGYRKMKEEEQLALRVKIEKILDLVSSREHDELKPSKFRRCGDDTDCGDNEELISRAVEILRE